MADDCVSLAGPEKIDLLWSLSTMVVAVQPLSSSFRAIRTVPEAEGSADPGVV
jgi:hypothetical protein